MSIGNSVCSCSQTRHHSNVFCNFFAQDLILAGSDISRAYLYCAIDVPIIMEQPTDSSRKLPQLWFLSKLDLLINGAH